MSEDKNWSTDLFVKNVFVPCEEYDRLTAAERERDSLRTRLAEHDATRPEVLWFATEMEKHLREHDGTKGKQGWHDMTFLELCDLLGDEREELADVLWHGTLEDVIREAADVANIAMMIADNSRRITKAREDEKNA